MCPDKESYSRNKEGIMDQILEKPPTSALKQRTSLSLQHFIPPELKPKAVLPPQKHRIHTLKRRTVLLVVTLVALMAFVAFVVMSYVFRWTWTGFPKNGTLWDWLDLFILPTALGVGTIWFTTQPRWHVEWTVALVVVLAVFMVLVVGGYFLGWTWTGFREPEKGNTLWNWIKLLLVPLIVLAVAKGVSTHQSQVSDTMGKQQQTDLQLAHERQRT
jgi:uncharacterized membrane protein